MWCPSPYFECLALFCLILQKASSYVPVTRALHDIYRSLPPPPPTHTYGFVLAGSPFYHDPTSRALSTRCLIPSLFLSQPDTPSAALSSSPIMFKKTDCQFPPRRFEFPSSGPSTSPVAVPLPCAGGFDPFLFC